MTAKLGKRIAAIALLAGVLVVALSIAFGGKDAEGDVAANPEQERLEAARERWEAADLAGYHFRFKWVCFCPPDFTDGTKITVRDGAIVGVTHPGDGDKNPDRYETVDGLFGMIEEAIAEGAARIDAEYHPTLGYPTNVYIDYSEQVVDEEQGFQISELAPVEP